MNLSPSQVGKKGKQGDHNATFEEMLCDEVGEVAFRVPLINIAQLEERMSSRTSFVKSASF